MSYLNRWNMSCWKAVTAVLILCWITLLNANNVYLKIKKIECTANERHIDNVTCNLKPLNWTRSVLNMDCDIIGTIENVSMRIDMFYRDIMHLYKPFGLHLEYNVCRLVGSAKPLNFLEKYSLYHFFSLTNVNHSCPFMGHLFARNFYLDELALPTIPLQEYKISFNFTDHNHNPIRYLGSLVLHFEVCQDYYVNRKRVKPKPGKREIINNKYLSD